MASKFRIEGGRAGVITIHDGDGVATLAWEMLVGDLDMVVYGHLCRWSRPEKRPVQRHELQRLVAELATEMRIDVQLDLEGSSTVLRGRR